MKTTETKNEIYRIFDVAWETDGIPLNECGSNTGHSLSELQEFLLEIEIEENDSKEDIEDILVDEVSDVTGWLHNGFRYELIDDSELKETE